MRFRTLFVVVAVLAATIGISGAAGADPAAPDASDNRNNAAVFDYWTGDRIASAIPRDLVIAENGLGYLKGANGELTPYGHNISAPFTRVTDAAIEGTRYTPQGKEAGTLAATITDMSPAEGTTIGVSESFTVNITNANVRAVNMFVGPVGSSKTKFSMTFVGGDTWQTNLQGFDNGDWEWYVEVREPRGVRTYSSTVVFAVDTGGGGGGGGGGGDCSGTELVTNSRWTCGGAVQTAAGRILFTMGGSNYVCSGTVATDGTSGRSIIITAAHCIYDEVADAFASNAIFIPSQDDGGTDRTDSDCSNDPIGCWVVDHGIVDKEWADRTWSDNMPWDYGYYVVSDTGAHSGTASSSALDVAAGSLTVDFTAPAFGSSATALGYSYSDDPYFMHCQEGLGEYGVSLFLGSCGLSGGASGGPWMQPVDGGNGVIISVNSWGWSSQPGMGAPRLYNNSAALLFSVAKSSLLCPAIGGFVIDPAAADRLPSVCILSPTDGSVVSGMVTIDANASDDKGVDSVEFFADGVSLGVDGSAPYTVDWDSTQVADGQTPISARVTDSAGQTRTTSVTVSVDNIPDTSVHVDDLDSSTTTLKGGKWSATVTITVVDSTSSPVAGVSVSGDWSAGDAGSVSCTTDASGQCQVESRNLNKRTSSVTFSIGGLAGDGVTYDPSSDVTSQIRVDKP